MNEQKQLGCEQEVDSPRATSRAERVGASVGSEQLAVGRWKKLSYQRQLFRTRRSSRAIGIALALTLFALLAAPLRAELVVVDNRDEGLLTTYKMIVTPAAEPVPALKERLVSRGLDLKDGNAAPYYYRALLGVGDLPAKLHKQYGDAYWDWQGDTPIDELPLEKLREAAKQWSNAIEESLRIASARRRCDWEWNLEEEQGIDVLSFMMPEISESRELSRAAGLQGRLALAEGDFDKAIDWLRMNYRLAHDIAEAPFLVSDLVGMGIYGYGIDGLIEFIAQPNSPNLYWAIAELPSPPIGIRESISSEMSNGLRLFPFILDAETVEHSPGEWSRLIAKSIFDSQSSLPMENHLSPTQARYAAVGMTLISYPIAKQRLIEGGMPADRVEEMPVGQVVSIDALHEYRRVADSIEKWMYVPYRDWKSRTIDKELHLKSGQGAWQSYGAALASSLLPAVRAARITEVRLVCLTGGIQTVEAIRMHAAATGKLPKTLDEIKIVPLPRNPITDKPYQYKLEGDTAVLELPFEDSFSNVAWRFEITLAK